MQQKVTNQLYSSVKTGLSYSLLLLFAFAFSLQQFSAFAYTQLAQNSKENASVIHPHQLVHHSPLSYHLPVAPNTLAYEMELMEEDDDTNRKTAIDDQRNDVAAGHLSDETDITIVLKSRYLQLASSANQRSTIPLFILHHSWKIYLA